MKAEITIAVARERMTQAMDLLDEAFEALGDNDDKEIVLEMRARMEKHSVYVYKYEVKRIGTWPTEKREPRG